MFRRKIIWSGRLRSTEHYHTRNTVDQTDSDLFQDDISPLPKWPFYLIPRVLHKQIAIVHISICSQD